VLRGVLDALGIERAGFVASSMGGLWSLWLERAAPERVAGLLLAGVPAVFLDTSAPFPMRLGSIRWLGTRMFRMDPGTPAQAARVMKRLGHPDADRIGEQHLELMASAARLEHYGESFASLVHQVLRVRGARFHFEEADFRRVAAPVHLVWGDRDPFGGLASARRALEIRPETRLDVVPGAGHLPWLDDAGVVVAAFTSMFAASAASPQRVPAAQGRPLSAPALTRPEPTATAPRSSTLS